MAWLAISVLGMVSSAALAQQTTSSSPQATAATTAYAMPTNPAPSPLSAATAPTMVQPVMVQPASGSITSDATAGIKIAVPSTPPTPPSASAFSNDPNQLALQAQQAAARAQGMSPAELEAQAEMERQKREQEHNEKSYNRAANGLLPLSPDQVREFMHKLERTQEASQAPYAGPPKGEVRIATLSLDPGVNPPQINLAAGYVTTINMVDATGEPWPILDVGVGGNFEVSPTPAGSHVVRVMPLSRLGTGNLSVLLKDLPTPVIFRLNAGGSNVDLRYDARIGKMGPGAKAPLIERPKLVAGSESMMLVLENAPPNDAKRMKVSGVDTRTKAWQLGDRVLVRTPLTLLSPGWNSSVSSGDGTTVYDIGDAPVLLLSDNGAMVRAQLLRDDDHDK